MLRLSKSSKLLASGEIVDDEAQTAETVEAIDEEAKTLTE